MSMINKSNVYVFKTDDRAAGVTELSKHFSMDRLAGKDVAIKTNYNSADPYPASTHIDTLSAIVRALKGQKASVVLGERSGMGVTGDVLDTMGVTKLADQLGFDVVVLDDLPNGQWSVHNPPGSHWKRGFLFPKIFSDADAIIGTCCLKTHRFGGHFTMSLKNSVGMVAKHDTEGVYNYMNELHSSLNQRLMIAEINTAYEPELVIMDAIEGFSTGGPESGTLIEPGIMMASNDRVALDACGVAVLRLFGTTPEVSRGSIFELEQIARAIQLDLGASRPEQIEIVPLNKSSEKMCENIGAELLRKTEPGIYQGQGRI
ncbi:MAG TPA: DUF362 domain-containing protein [Methanocellaceae archaeon]